MTLTDIQHYNAINLMMQAPAILDILHDIINNSPTDIKVVLFTCDIFLQDMTIVTYELRIEDSQLHLSKELQDKIIKKFLVDCVLKIGDKRIIQFDLGGDYLVYC